MGFGPLFDLLTFGGLSRGAHKKLRNRNCETPWSLVYSIHTKLSVGPTQPDRTSFRVCCGSWCLLPTPNYSKAQCRNPNKKPTSKPKSQTLHPKTLNPKNLQTQT